MSPNLHDLLNYKNTKLLSRYEKDFPYTKINAEEALQELMKYIWLCYKHKADKTIYPCNDSLEFTCVMHAEMKEIDNMWHTFLLFTRDYQQFCQDYLQGEFFHHDPIVETNNMTEEKYEKELSLYLSYVYDNLGEKTLKKWFEIDD